jgi:hypothetical protein
VLKLDAGYNFEFRHAVDPAGPAENLRGKQIIERQQELYVFGTVYIGDLGINTCFLYGIDLQGNALDNYWEWYPGESEFQAVTLSTDNHFVAVSNGRDLFAGGYAIVAVKLDDQSGSFIWEQVLNIPDSVYLVSDILTAPDGGYLVSGSKNSHGLVFKLDAGGNTVWQTEFHWSDNPNALQVLNFDRLALTASGDGFFAVGSNPLYIPQIALASICKATSYGTKPWAFFSTTIMPAISLPPTTAAACWPAPGAFSPIPPTGYLMLSEPTMPAMDSCPASTAK